MRIRQLKNMAYMKSTSQVNRGISVVHRASAALELLRAGRKVDLVFSDIMMPDGMNGLELAQIIKKEFPKLPILLTTSSFPSGHLPGRRSRTQQTPAAMLQVRKRERLRLPRASGRCGFCEGTFAGTRGSDGDAPKGVARRGQSKKPVSTQLRHSPCEFGASAT
jgi:CheY-like chemotaxis protein